MVLLHSFLQVALGSHSESSSETEFQRGTFDIVWSCTSTIILSAWVTARPNVIPQSNTRHWEHIKLMIRIIIAPELILVCALKQLYSAHRIKSMFEGWTLTHAYFLIMGGFSILDQHNKHRILTYEDFDRGFSVRRNFSIRRGFNKSQMSSVLTFDFRHGTCINDPHDESEIPTFNFHHGFSIFASKDTFLQSIMQRCVYRKTIVLGEINDRSKNDWLLQLSSILYALRFVFQYGSRVYYGVESTELEFSTLVLVVLHTIIYIVWWHKPIGVQEAKARPSKSNSAAGGVDAGIPKFWRERWFSPDPIPILSIVTFRIGLILCFTIIRVGHTLVLSIPSAVRLAKSALCENIPEVVGTYYRESHWPHFSWFDCTLVACLVLPDCFFVIPIVTLLQFIATLLNATDDVTLAETSRYILRTFRRIILATLHFSEKGFLGLINLPVLCIGFVLLLAVSPFALSITIVLRFTNTEFKSITSHSLISQACKMVISAAHSVQQSFKSILKAPDRSQFGVTYYILFIPLTLLITFLFLVGFLFDLLFLVEEPISRITQRLSGASEVPLLHAPFPKGARYPCLVAATIIGLTFFGLQCIGWDSQIPYHSTLQMSWRITCLVNSAIPVIAIPLIRILKEEDVDPAYPFPFPLIRIPTYPSEKHSIMLILPFLPNVMACFLLLVYSCTKISLIPQAIVLLILRTHPSAV